MGNKKDLFRIVFVLSILFPAFVTAEVTILQQMTMVKELMPSLKSITVVCNVTDVQPALREIKAAAESLGLGLTIFDVRTFPELHRVFRNFSTRTVDLVWMVPDSVAGGDKMVRRFMQENCIRKKIPLYAYSEEVLREGALMFMSTKENQPVFYLNKAVASLMDFKLPPDKEAKVTPIE